MVQDMSWRRCLATYGACAVVVLVADQITKWWAIATLTRAFSEPTQAAAFGDRMQRFLWTKHPSRGGVVAVLDDFWHFRYVENPGAAWGFLSGSASALRTPFFLAVSVFAVVFILMYLRRTEAKQWLLRGALSLVLGGAVGNFLDRVRLGYVIDFIDWHWYDKATWPTFNVADAGITVGVILMLIDMLTTAPAKQ